MAVLKLLIRYRCKEAEKIQKALVVENIAANNGKKRKRLLSSRNYIIYFLLAVNGYILVM